MFIFRTCLFIIKNNLKLNKKNNVWNQKGPNKSLTVYIFFLAINLSVFHQVNNYYTILILFFIFKPTEKSQFRIAYISNKNTQHPGSVAMLLAKKKVNKN